MKRDERRGVHRLDSPARRRLLKFASASGLLACLERNIAMAQGATDFRAIVCIFLAGGNDGENTLIRHDTPGYQAYAAVRTSASGLNIPRDQLLPVQPARSATPPLGFHPSCAELASLFERKRLAVIANMGVLAAPVTRATVQASGATPANLFSHSDQQLITQTADPTGTSHFGWGGRIADRLDTFNVGTAFPPLVTTSGLRPFCAGMTSIPVSLGIGNNSQALGYSGDGRYDFDVLRDAAMREILAQERTNIYDAVAQLYAEEGFAAASVVAPILQGPNSMTAPHFSQLNSYFQGQIGNIARLIEAREQTKLKRQVFFAHQGGYDTHSGQLGIHAGLLAELSKGLGAFDRAMDAIGLSQKVTVLVISEFGRTFKPAGNQGTDHGWGNYAFVLGGAVNGGDVYGTLPTMALNGPDDFSDAGRWIPTTSLEQCGATLCRWFGIPESDLPYVFPNIAAFPNTNLGFMA